MKWNSVDISNVHRCTATRFFFSLICFYHLWIRWYFSVCILLLCNINHLLIILIVLRFSALHQRLNLHWRLKVPTSKLISLCQCVRKGRKWSGEICSSSRVHRGERNREIDHSNWICLCYVEMIDEQFPSRLPTRLSSTFVLFNWLQIAFSRQENNVDGKKEEVERRISNHCLGEATPNQATWSIDQWWVFSF